MTFGVFQKRVCRRLEAAGQERGCPPVKVSAPMSWSGEGLPDSGQRWPRAGVGSIPTNPAVTHLNILIKIVNNHCSDTSAAVIC